MSTKRTYKAKLVKKPTTRDGYTYALVRVHPRFSGIVTIEPGWRENYVLGVVSDQERQAAQEIADSLWPIPRPGHPG